MCLIWMTIKLLISWFVYLLLNVWQNNYFYLVLIDYDIQDIFYKLKIKMLKQCINLISWSFIFKWYSCNFWFLFFFGQVIGLYWNVVLHISVRPSEIWGKNTQKLNILDIYIFISTYCYPIWNYTCIYRKISNIPLLNIL